MESVKKWLKDFKIVAKKNQPFYKKGGGEVSKRKKRNVLKIIKMIKNNENLVEVLVDRN